MGHSPESLTLCLGVQVCSDAEEEEEVCESSRESLEQSCEQAREQLTNSIRLQWRKLKNHMERLDSQGSPHARPLLHHKVFYSLCRSMTFWADTGVCSRMAELEDGFCCQLYTLMSAKIFYKVIRLYI